MKLEIIFCAGCAVVGFAVSAFVAALLGHPFSVKGPLLVALSLVILGLAVIVIVQGKN